jgi:hypothetical protein
LLSFHVLILKSQSDKWHALMRDPFFFCVGKKNRGENQKKKEGLRGKNEEGTCWFGG